MTRTQRIVAILTISGAVAGGTGTAGLAMASHVTAPAAVQHVQADGNGGNTLYRG